MKRVNFKTFVSCLIFLSFSFGLTQAAHNVYVNSVRLDENTLSALENYYGYIPDSHYWYDPASGLVGLQDGPSSGKIDAGLPLGGRLQANASGGGTGVLINGRELHIIEITYLQQLLGVVYPGYYWMDAQGNIGVEGGGFLFNLYAVSNGSNNNGIPSHDHSLTGSVIGDSNVVGFIDGDVGITCAPDGGCIGY